MRRLTAILLGSALALVALPLAWAGDGDVEVEPFGYLRVRGEYVDNLTDVRDEDFGGAVDPAFDDEFGFATYRARVGLNAMLPRDVTLTLDFQALGRFGDSGAFDGFHGLSVFPHSSDSTHLFQGYIDLANIKDTNLSLRAGRQAMVLGDEWLVGDSEFYGGTSFDAVRLDWTYGEGNRITGFWAKLAETDVLFTTVSLGSVNGLQPDGGFASDVGAEDVDLWGLWNTWSIDDEQTLDGYVLRLDHRLQPFPSSFNNTLNNTEDRWTVGLRFNRPKGDGWDLNVNAAYQFGDIAAFGLIPADTDFDGTIDPGEGLPDLFDAPHDIRAYALEVEGGWTFERANGLTNRVRAFAATYTGEDDESDRTDRRFSILFQDRHGRYGIADFFTGVFLPNLVSDISGIDIYGLGFDAELGERFSTGGNIIAANVAKNPLVVNPSMAYEADVYFGLDYNDFLRFDVGFAHVFARSFFLDNPKFGSDSNASRVYVNAVATF